MMLRFGAIPIDGGVRFTVWAPAQKDVALVLEGEPDRPMERTADGFFTLEVPGAHAGQRYWYRIASGLRPDPASRFQPEGPLGPSEIVDPRRFTWTDAGWPGAGPVHRHVFYELHVGTFTREGTFTAALRRLPRLAEVGITTIELMPLAEFAGRFGWGYDGVNLFAPTRLYGTPDEVRRFVDEAHRLGLAVILDVVYNHLGPVGNFLPEFSPSVHGPPGEWGDSINYDGEASAPVRQFVIENAAYWIADFHFDGLRLDATHAIPDRSKEHIVSDICAAARRAAGERTVFIAAENEAQDTRLLKASGAYLDGADALWNEDWHHSAFVALTGRREAYFSDYLGTAAEFASMARHGTLYQGQWYTWQKKPRGGYAIGLPSSCFVCFLENHDQIANTGLGARLFQYVGQPQWRAMTALLLLGPGLPLLFQGAEFGSTRPFTYFADHDGDLASAVDRGRREFLSQFPSLATDDMQQAIASPSDPRTFEQCQLLDEERFADTGLLHLHQDLLRLRRDDPVLSRIGTPEARIESAAPASHIVLIRYLASGAHRLLVVNLGDDHLSPMNDPLYAPPPGCRWKSVWSSEHPQYGGGGAPTFPEADRWLIGGHTATLLGSEEREPRE
jgi:maltooligosyltrehalose trehalohydrolase